MPSQAARRATRRTRVVIASRIFAPEPSAASFRLRALANAYSKRGVDVRVLTSRPPREYADVDPGVADTVDLRRAPVLRDADGYVRGYAQYMSFDVPLLLRLLCTRKLALVVTEPPPTTGAVVRLVCMLRRIPYAYYAADIWADALGAVETPGIVAKAVRGLEQFALRGASHVLSVSEGVTSRLHELGIVRNVHTVGNGIDLAAFAEEGPRETVDGPYFLYAGTASEVHGAGIFLEAFQELWKRRPDVRLVYVGQGSERPHIERAAAGLPSGTVRFLPRLEPEAVASWLRGSVASLASLRPGQGYDFAFPTKLYASAATGTPAIFAGSGPGANFVAAGRAGFVSDYTVRDVADAMERALECAAAASSEAERHRIAKWAHQEWGLDRVAQRAVNSIEIAVTPSRPQFKGHGA